MIELIEHNIIRIINNTTSITMTIMAITNIVNTIEKSIIAIVVIINTVSTISKMKMIIHNNTQIGNNIPQNVLEQCDEDDANVVAENKAQHIPQKQTLSFFPKTSELYAQSQIL